MAFSSMFFFHRVQCSAKFCDVPGCCRVELLLRHGPLPHLPGTLAVARPGQGGRLDVSKAGGREGGWMSARQGGGKEERDCQEDSGYLDVIRFLVMSSRSLSMPWWKLQVRKKIQQSWRKMLNIKLYPVPCTL